MITLNFLLTSLIVVLIPGTGVVYTISTGLTLGKRASIVAALGCTAGIVPHLVATVLGLSAVMHTSALAFQVLKYAGVAYLLRSRAAAPTADAQWRLYGDDICCVYHLWPAGACVSPGGDRVAARPVLVAPQLRRRLRRARH